MDNYSDIPLWFVAFLLSVTCHEAAHALAAKWGGDLTAYQAGQVTLNPMPHIQREPWGMVLMPILSLIMSGGNSLIGWGSAPYDPYWEQRYPKRAAWMALAGPAANVLLVVVAAVLINAGRAAKIFAASSGDVERGFFHFLAIMFEQNVLLAVFNMMPVYPLDGNTAISLILPQDAAEKFREFTRTGFMAMFGIWIAWILARPLVDDVTRFAIKILL